MKTALITGASSGIGAIYAKRLAARGHNIVLVARATERLEKLASELRNTYGIETEVISADLTDFDQLQPVLKRLKANPTIDILVNNAGAGLISNFTDSDMAAMDKLIDINVVAPTRLASAVIGKMVERGEGAIINIASGLAIAPEYSLGIYAATKSYIMALSQSLSAEVGSKGVYIQAVLPAATRTEIFERAGGDINMVPDVMEVEDMVDAALVGFDRKELITMPSLHDISLWERFELARDQLAQGFSSAQPAPRYK